MVLKLLCLRVEDTHALDGADPQFASFIKNHVIDVTAQDVGMSGVVGCTYAQLSVQDQQSATAAYIQTAGIRRKDKTVATRLSVRLGKKQGSYLYFLGVKSVNASLITGEYVTARKLLDVCNDGTA